MSPGAPGVLDSLALQILFTIVPQLLNSTGNSLPLQILFIIIPQPLNSIGNSLALQILFKIIRQPLISMGNSLALQILFTFSYIKSYRRRGVQGVCARGVCKGSVQGVCKACYLTPNRKKSRGGSGQHFFTFWFIASRGRHVVN